MTKVFEKCTRTQIESIGDGPSRILCRGAHACEHFAFYTIKILSMLYVGVVDEAGRLCKNQ